MQCSVTPTLATNPNPNLLSFPRGHLPCLVLGGGGCCRVNDAHPRRLRSADPRTHLVSRTLINFGDRTFSAAGPRVWNKLPTDLRQPNFSYSRFRTSLKTFLFGLWELCMLNMTTSLPCL